MKPIKHHRVFEKHFKKRIITKKKLLAQFEERLALFASGERGWPLDDHPLSGKLIGRRAFSVNGDVRVIYEETELFIILLDIGTHNQVY
jgi:addiction module RelE/StbE family toxin